MATIDQEKCVVCNKPIPYSGQPNATYHAFLRARYCQNQRCATIVRQSEKDYGVSEWGDAERGPGCWRSSTLRPAKNSLPMKRKEQIELLRQILATVDLSEFPEAIRASVQEAIADLGGCAFCGRAATLLCDFTLGYEIDETFTKWPCCKSDGERYTCDAPLCEQCGRVVGWTTITGVPSSIDYCPAHANRRDTDSSRPMTKHDAERLRIAAWKRTLFSIRRPAPSQIRGGGSSAFCAAMAKSADAPDLESGGGSLDRPRAGANPVRRIDIIAAN